MSRIRYEKGLVCFLFALAPQPEKDEREVSAYSWCMLVCLAGRRLRLKTKKFSGSEVLVLRTPVWAGVRKVARQLTPRKCGLCSQGTNSYVQRQKALRVSSGRKDDSCKKIYGFKNTRIRPKGAVDFAKVFDSVPHWRLLSKAKRE